MRIKMLETKMGVNDGKIYPEEFEKGKEYTVGKALGNAFIKAGFARPVKKAKGSHENKAKKPHENK